MMFINTRPQSRNQLLTEALQKKGFEVFNFPLLELNEIAISQREQHYQQTLIAKKTIPEPYKVLVVISPTAASIGLQNCPHEFIPSCPVIAVGTKTAEVLRNVGWQVSCPIEASNEGMMTMSGIFSLQKGDKVLIWRGRGGRRLLSNHLQDKNVLVHAIAWYQRQCPNNIDESFKDLQSQLKRRLKSHSLLSSPIVLISSGEAFTNWRSLLSESNNYKLDDFRYLTFGHRLTNTLNKLNLVCIRINNLDPNEVLLGIDAF